MFLYNSTFCICSINGFFLLDQNGVIISEFYTDLLELELSLKLMNSIKEHLIILKKMQLLLMHFSGYFKNEKKL